MSISMIIILTLIFLVMFGLGQRLLDKMRLSDKWALGIMVAILVGMFIPAIYIGKYFSFSIGGFLIPFAVCVYLLIKCGFSFDLLRAIIGTIVTTAVIVGISYLMPSKTPEDIVLPNSLLYGVSAGIVAYVLGRSRRNAFICAVLGVTLSSVVQFLIPLIFYRTLTTLSLGAAGAFDAIVIAALVAVGLAELIGKTSEAVIGKKAKLYNMEAGEFVEIDKESKPVKKNKDCIKKCNAKKTTKKSKEKKHEK